MTAIVGYWDGREAWLAADGRASWGDSVPNDSFDKFVRSGDWIFGYAGPSRGMVALRKAELAKCSTIDEVAEALRSALESDKWATLGEQGRPPSYKSAILVASKEGLWIICSEFCPMAVRVGWTIGIGSGGEVATGAAQALIDRGDHPGEALREAIHVASTKDQYTGGSIRSWCSSDHAIRVHTGRKEG